MKVNILGTEYEIIVKAYDEEKSFKERGIDGFCDFYTKIIVICDFNTNDKWKDETQEARDIVQKETLRHEIVHAFLAESGLAYNAFVPQHSWAINEEMVDWIALQLPKIHKACEEAGCL